MTCTLRDSAVKARASRGDWLEPLAGHWTGAAVAQLRRHTVLVRVTVASLRGSTPREAGASMLVSAHGTLGTIGGGQLEWRAIQQALELLRSPQDTTLRIEDFTLGPDLGQCCGGRVELWLERLRRRDLSWLRPAAQSVAGGTPHALVTELRKRTLSHRLLEMSAGSLPVQVRHDPGRATLVERLGASRPPLWIFGAGHVGQALVRLLAELASFDIAWVDPRAELLPSGLNAGVTLHAPAAPVELLQNAAPGTHFVVLTHDHALDYALCRAILLRRDAAWLGLIGSASKAARFRSRLLREPLDAATVDRLTCPVGIPGIASKVPTAIAIAIAAQLLQRTPTAAPSAPQECGTGCAGCASPGDRYRR